MLNASFSSADKASPAKCLGKYDSWTLVFFASWKLVFHDARSGDTPDLNWALCQSYYLAPWSSGNLECKTQMISHGGSVGK